MKNQYPGQHRHLHHVSCSVSSDNNIACLIGPCGHPLPHGSGVGLFWDDDGAYVCWDPTVKAAPAARSVAPELFARGAFSVVDEGAPHQLAFNWGSKYSETMNTDQTHDLVVALRTWELSQIVTESTSPDVTLKPYEVVLKHDPEHIVGFVCPICHIFSSWTIYLARREVAVQAAYDAAVRCCQRRCDGCGVRLEKKNPYICCDSCRAERDAIKEAEREAKATRIADADYTGPVYLDSGVGSKDGYFTDTDELREYFDDEGEPVPDTAWACTIELLELDASNLLENALQSHHEDASDAVDSGSTASLQAVLDQWVAEHASGVQSWNYDYTRLVELIPNPPETDAHEPRPAAEPDPVP